MKIFTALKAATLAMALGAGAANAEIINLPSFDLANPDVATSPTTVAFGPGTYNVSVIGTAQGGQYDGWRVFNTGGYDERYGYSFNGNSTSVWPNPSLLYNTAADALAAYSNVVSTFTLTALTDVAFQVTDSFYFDNAGGVSLQVTPAAPTDVPEPPMLALFALAAGGVMFFYGRRRRTAA